MRPATPSAVQPARLFDSRGDLDHPFEEMIEPATLAHPPCGHRGGVLRRNGDRLATISQANRTTQVVPLAIAGLSPCSSKAAHTVGPTDI